MVSGFSVKLHFVMNISRNEYEGNYITILYYRLTYTKSMLPIVKENLTNQRKVI